MEDRSTILRRKMTEVDYTELRYISLFRIHDTPLAVLYRLYECTCTRSHNETMEESQYLFHHQPLWRVKDIPDPKDPDPVRYAILASLAETLATSFNFKINLGLRRGITNEKPLLIAQFRHAPDPPLEEPPAWCPTVIPLKERLVLSPGLIQTPYEHFTKRNILADVHQLWNI